MNTPLRRVCCLLLYVSAPLLSQAPTSKQQQIESHFSNASEYLKTNRPDQAASEFAAIIALDPANADAQANFGVLVFFQGDYARAAPSLREALKLRPDLWKIQALLGLCEKRLGQISSARNNLEAAFPQLQEEKLRVQVGMELTELDYASGQLDKAAAAIAVLRQLRPADPDVLYTAHRVYSDLADECMLTVAMTAPDSARMHQLMANEMMKRGKVDGAIAQYRQAVTIDAKLPGVHFQLAEALAASSSENERAQAEKEYQAAITDNPLDAKSECRLGELAFARSDPKAALARYRHAVELQPDDADANLGLARALMETGEPAKAEHYLLKASASDPSDPVTHMRLATLYRESGREADAARELAEFRRLKELKDRLREVYVKHPEP